MTDEMNELETQAIDDLETDIERALAGGMKMPMGGRPRTGATSGGAAGAMGPQHMGAPHPDDLAAIKKPGIVSRVASGIKKVGAAMSGGAKQPAFARSIECPHCGGGMSKGYAVSALKILAKSEGYDFDNELDGLDDPDATKGTAADVGIHANAHRGPKPGKMATGVRPGGKQKVDRKVPSNKTFGKSLNLPIITGDTSIVSYSTGEDAAISKSIEDGNMHVPPARNFRMERQLAGYDDQE